MPQRVRGALSGLGAGLSDVGTEIIRRRQQTAVQQSQVTDALLKDFTDRVVKGDLDADQAEAAMAQRGVRVPAGFFRVLEQSPESQLQKISTGITKAGTVQEVPGPLAIAQQMPKRLPLMTSFDQGPFGFAPPGQTTGGLTKDVQGNVMSQPGSLPSPAFQSQLDLRNEKLNQFPPERIETVEPSGATFTKFVPSRPDILGGLTLPKTLSAEQLGKNKAAESLAQAQGERAGNLGTLQGQTEQQKQLASTFSPEVIRANAQKEAAAAAARSRAEMQAQMNQMGLLPQQQQAALALADDFQNQSKDFFTVQDQFRKMAAFSQSPAGDLGLIFAFMKVLDPNSVVREGEQASAQNATGVPDKIRNYYNRVMTGERLNPAERTDFLKQAASIYSASTVEHQNRVSLFTERANQYRVPPFLVVRPASPDLRQRAATAIGPQTKPSYIDPKLVTPIGK